MRQSSVAVIGMHRSGTSCLAGCLEELGLSLGDVVTSAPHNKKGNRENPRFWPLHDGILARADASWDRPPHGPIVWTAQEKAELKALLGDYEGLPRPWGFKDPRATLLLDGWLEVVPDLRLIGSIRHPEAVAGSLAARNGFAPETSRQIWAGYNRALMDWHSRLGFAVINYDDADYEAKVRDEARAFGLNPDAEMTFREAGLNHQGHAEAPVPSDSADLWQQLLAIAK